MSSAPAAESMPCTCDSFRDRTWRALPFLGIVGFSTHKRSLLSPCHSALRQGRGSSSACKSMSVAHRLLFGVVLNVACQHHRANRSVRVPVPLIPSHLRLVPFSPSLVGATQAPLRDSTHVSYPDPRIGTLTPPAGAEQCSGYPSPVGQDPSDTETLTGPGMRTLCQRSWLRAKPASC